MKEIHLWLLNGSEIALKYENEQELLYIIDNFFDTFKENVSYYLGYDDESIVEQLKDNDIEVEIIDLIKD